MSGSNALLPFATGSGANVISDAAYAALTARLTGFQAGVALSAQLNKAWRQSGFVAAMIGQFTADYSGDNVNDDGDVATFEASFRDAIQSLSSYTGVYSGIDGGTANIMVVNPNPAATSYFEGMLVLVQKGSATNSNTTPTINVNSLGAKTVTKEDGTALVVGDLPANARMLLSYNATDGKFRLVGLAPSDVLSIIGSSYAPDTGSANAIVVTLSPVPTSYTNGMFVRTKIAATNTGATTINVNGLGLKNVTHTDQSALVKGDIQVGEMAILQYDGTQFQLQNPAPLNAKNRSFFATKPVDQSLSNSTFTDITWTASAPAWATWDGTSLTFTQAGEYLVTLQLSFSTIITASGYINSVTNLSLNGSIVSGGAAQIFPPSSGNYAQGAGCSVTLTINAGDVLKVRGYDGSTVYNAGGVSGGTSNYFTVTRQGG